MSQSKTQLFIVLTHMPVDRLGQRFHLPSRLPSVESSWLAPWRTVSWAGVPTFRWGLKGAQSVGETVGPNPAEPLP